MSGATKKETTATTSNYKIVKLPGITKVTNLRGKWNPNVDALRQKAKTYFKGLPPIESKYKTTEIVDNNKFPVVSFELTTADGYKINLFHIPHGFTNKSILNRRPVLLVHGLLSCSDDWVRSGVDNGLGYLLAEEGYDVWLGNCRGTRYSNFHTKYTKEDSKFWNFTLHEMAIYDIPVMIDFILEKSGRSKLFYIGYCQGTTLSYILCSQIPEYNAKIALNISLAPIVYAKHMQCPVIKIIGHLKDKEVLGSYFSKKNYEVQDEVRRKCSKFIDCKGNNSDILCLNNMFVSFGYNPQNMTSSLLPTVFNDDLDSPASLKQFLHYSQLCKSGRFCPWDYGDENEIKYNGASSPPEYDVKNIITPIIIFIGKEDWVSRVEDATAIKSKFTKAAVTIEELPTYTHLDFLYGLNVAEELYLRILQKFAAIDIR